ncbi:hypothetical protein ACKI1K_08265 [Streptomyces scabiei]|uniref:hypothetical protein n=1 Tax=Streptomyces scabiei TaxID=1930 RepID=UPI0038F7E1A7
MQTEPRLPESEALEFLELLKGAPFSAPYAGQVIDWLIRDSSAQPTVQAADLTPAARAVATLWRYAASRDPGAGEISQRMSDVTHALTLIRDDHYAADHGPRSAHRGVRPLRGRDVRKLCVAVGHSRSLAGPGRAVVIVHHSHDHTVYRPLGALVRSGPPCRSREKLGREVLAILAPHVRLADRRSCEGSGVLVESRREAVTVAWWSPDPASESGYGHAEPWSSGGLRSLCSTLLRSEGMTISQSDGALLVSR